MHCCAVHHGLRNINVHDLFATVDACNALADPRSRCVVMEELVVSRWVPGAYRLLHWFAALFTALPTAKYGGSHYRHQIGNTIATGNSFRLLTKEGLEQRTRALARSSAATASNRRTSFSASDCRRFARSHLISKRWNLESTAPGAMQRPAGLRPRDFTFRCAQPGSGRTPRSMIAMELRRGRRCNGSICEMGPWSGRLHEYAAYLVGNCSKLHLLVDQLFSNLHYLRSIEGHCRVNHDKSGTASAANGCMVLVDLFLCNEFLWVIAFELHQISPGRLTLACLRGRVVHVAPNMQRRPSFGLVLWLLMAHRCIEIVELRDSGVQQNHFLIRDGSSLSRNQGNVKLCNYLLDDYPPRDLMDALRSTVATFDTLEIISVHFPSVGVPMQCKLLGWCEAVTACASTLHI
ncbi:hypothetical protein HPB49_005207 [Dermacentor silvarum]|uniref:Uncharacterized protein n=1 Tax=Dermacentor silvarum TaxID=543639 RepID=A0ACB8DV79_DERSI|nr:hypothetical protein HPB49_005207 [Dermacentor silvarum]